MNKISKLYKIAATTHNVAGKCEKGLVILAFIATGIKVLSAFMMDRTGKKTFKTNRR